MVFDYFSNLWCGVTESFCEGRYFFVSSDLFEQSLCPKVSDSFAFGYSSLHTWWMVRRCMRIVVDYWFLVFVDVNIHKGKRFSRTNILDVKTHSKKDHLCRAGFECKFNRIMYV